MQRLEVSGAVRLLYGSLGVKGLINVLNDKRLNRVMEDGRKAEHRS